MHCVNIKFFSYILSKLKAFDSLEKEKDDYFTTTRVVMLFNAFA